MEFSKSKYKFIVFQEKEKSYIQRASNRDRSPNKIQKSIKITNQLTFILNISIFERETSIKI